MGNILGKNITKLQGALVLVMASVLVCGGVHAQVPKASLETSLKAVSKQIEKPIVSNSFGDNPFDFVQDQAENPRVSAPNMKFRKNKKMGRTADLDVQTRKLAKPKTALQYHKKYNTSPEQSQALYNTLVRKYGKPKSIRGQSHVWDIKNPSRGGSQADIVTVIMKISKNGEYELIMDRDRGEDGRATWAAPRMKKLVVEKPQKKNLKKHLILQPDND